MAAQGSHGQAAFASDTTLLLQTLLMTPVALKDPPHGSADVYGNVLGSLRIDEAQTLLQTLLATPLPPSLHLRPVTLHTVEQLHNLESNDRQRSDWFDGVLGGAQRALIVIALLTLGTWAALGPVGNWLHTQYAPSVALLPARPISTVQVKLPRPQATSIYLPITERLGVLNVSKVVAAPQEEYLVQRQTLVESQVAAPAPQPTHLLIPSIAVDTPIQETFYIDGDWQVAQYAAGYLHDTGLPGDTGNVVIAGHAGFFGGVFARLGSLKTGDDVYVDAAGWRYHYRVGQSIVVWPTQTEFVRETDIPIMTLITCTNWDLQRQVVIANLIGAKPL